MILLLSDVENSSSSLDGKTIDIAESLHNTQGIIIYTIALGEGADAVLLKNIADKGQGLAFQINESGNLTQEQVDAEIEQIYAILLKHLSLKKQEWGLSESTDLEYNGRYHGDDYETAKRMYTAKVNRLTGNYMEQVEDLNVQSPGGGLSLQRTYNSAAGDEKTLVGRGWRLNYDSSVKIVDSAASEVKTAKVTATALNVRQEPMGEIITVLNRNTEVFYLEANKRTLNGKDWYYVQLRDGRQGYVAAWYLEEISGIEVTYGSGTKIIFEKEGQSYQAPFGVYDTLVDTGTEYRLTRQDKTKYF